MCVDSLQPIPSRSVLSSSFDDAIFHLSTAKLAVPLKTESGEGKAANRNPRTHSSPLPLSRRAAGEVSRACERRSDRRTAVRLGIL